MHNSNRLTQPDSSQHPFRLLASAIVGRSVFLSFLKTADAKAYSDGERIYLPLRKNAATQRAEILVQALLIKGNSLQPGLMAGLVGRNDLKQRYLLLEVERCAHRYRERLPSWLLETLVSSGLATSQRPASARDSLTLAKTAITLAAIPHWYGAIYPIRLLRSRAGQSGDPLQSDSLAQLEAQLQQLEQQLLQDDDEQKTKDNFWQLLASPRGKEGIISKLLRELLDMSSGADGSSTEAGVNSSMEKVSGKWVERLNDVTNALRSLSEVALPSAFVESESGAHSYPEWDSAKGRYRPDWVSVEEVEAWSREEDHAISSFGSGSNRPYQKMLAGLCFNLERHRNQLFGDDLVLDQLVGLATNIKAGFSGDERVYQANLRTRRDLGVQILVDASSSTLETVDNERKVCDLQMEAAWQLCRAFSALGDPVAMHGFHSWGRSLVRLQRLKHFNEPLGARVEQRCQQLSVAGYTRCGAAIRHSIRQLKQFSGMPCNLLLVISDGYPYDDQYEGDYAAEDTRKALQEARNDNIACVCLSIGSDVNASKLQKIYGDANYLCVNDVGKLTTRLRPVIEAAIASRLQRT